MADVEAFSARTAYRRQARRLRASLAHDATAMHRALNELADWSNRPSPSPLRSRQSASPPASHPYFSALVARRFKSGCFTLTDRAQLLNQASKLGIDRFTANLILATEQHRAKPVVVTTPPTDLPPVGGAGSMLAAFIVLQVCILAAAAWLCRL